VHFHALVLDGVFTRPPGPAAPVFHALPPPTDDEIAAVLDQVHARAQRLLHRRGRLPEEPSPTDPIADQLPLLAGYAAASIQGRVASGPRAGQPVRRLRSAAAVADTHKPRCARREGFSLHANVALPAHARAGREHLCRYLLRPPLALERLAESSGGQLLYQLAHPRADGATHLLLDPLELIEKLCVLVPALSFAKTPPDGQVVDLAAPIRRQPRLDDHPPAPPAPSQWYVHDGTAPIVFGLGIHGQSLVVHRKHGIVIAKVSSRALPIDAERAPLRLWPRRASAHQGQGSRRLTPAPFLNLVEDHRPFRGA